MNTRLGNGFYLFPGLRLTKFGSCWLEDFWMENFLMILKFSIPGSMAEVIQNPILTIWVISNFAKLKYFSCVSKDKLGSSSHGGLAHLRTVVQIRLRTLVEMLNIHQIIVCTRCVVKLDITQLVLYNHVNNHHIK